MTKPYSESCDQNKEPIERVIGPSLRRCEHLLEIGSGTGQHAVYFGQQFPHLVWQTSDVLENHDGIRMWLGEAQLVNVRAPIELDVSRDPWPTIVADSVFTANTIHIMNDENVLDLFVGVGQVLQPGGQFFAYGPFNYGNEYTSDSNAQFDGWLKSRDPDSGIKNFEELCRLAERSSMVLVDDHEMPANNRILHWRKV